MHPDLRGYLGYCFFKVANRIRAKVDEKLRPFGVVAPQFGMLRLLDSGGSMTQKELGEFMGMDKATLVRMIDGLEELKFLKRVPSTTDRRINHLVLTAAGRTSMRKMDGARKLAENEFLAVISRAEQRQLRAIVDKLIDLSDH